MHNYHNGFVEKCITWFYISRVPQCIVPICYYLISAILLIWFSHLKIYIVGEWYLSMEIIMSCLRNYKLASNRLCSYYSHFGIQVRVGWLRGGTTCQPCASNFAQLRYTSGSCALPSKPCFNSMMAAMWRVLLLLIWEHYLKLLGHHGLVVRILNPPSWGCVFKPHVCLFV